MFWSTLWRIIVVPVAFAISGLFAALVLVTLGLERVTHAFHGEGMDEADSVFAVFDLVSQGVVLASGLTILPALIVVLVGEVARIRSALYYIVGGGAALAAVPLLSQLGYSAGVVLPSATVWQVFATAGFGGGFIYWLLAGRRA
ncbi:MAG: hypothetical protein KJZ80_16465 [Hyphomicrobiaceae bacterium]|nr:hypothetical protein [Hyphomicrobiaceae bacterium]